MADNSNGKYLNGLFVSKREGNYGEYLSVGITDDGIEALKNLPKSESGFRNFTLNPQRNDPNKYSAKPFAPKTSGDDDNGGLPF